MSNVHPAETDLASKLSRFSQNNKSSSVNEGKPDGKTALVVTNPWGDNSLVLRIRDDIDEVCNALNEVFLPERYTAIYHMDTKDVEIIFTANPLGEELRGLIDRKFIFQHRGTDFVCEFGRASERLLAISTCAVPVAQSVTDYRNLQSFGRYVRSKQPGYQGVGVGSPICFWIKGFEWDEDKALVLVQD